MGYALVVDRVERLSQQLSGDEQSHAARVVEICRELETRARRAGKLLPDSDDRERKKELARLSELLGRRTSKALPAATLGRAALADLHQDERAFEVACADCDAKLALWGM